MHDAIDVSGPLRACRAVVIHMAGTSGRLKGQPHIPRYLATTQPNQR
jgi:hypothetical protein